MIQILTLMQHFLMVSLKKETFKIKTFKFFHTGYDSDTDLSYEPTQQWTEVDMSTDSSVPSIFTSESDSHESQHGISTEDTVPESGNSSDSTVFNIGQYGTGGMEIFSEFNFLTYFLDMTWKL